MIEYYHFSAPGNITKREVTGHYMPPCGNIFASIHVKALILSQIKPLYLIYRKFRGRETWHMITTEAELAEFRLGKHTDKQFSFNNKLQAKKR